MGRGAIRRLGAFLLLAGAVVEYTGADPSYMNDWVNPSFVVGPASMDSKLAASKATIAQVGQKSAKGGPFTVSSANSVRAPSGDPKDYLSWAPYHWPNCNWCSKPMRNQVVLSNNTCPASSSSSSAANSSSCAEHGPSSDQGGGEVDTDETGRDGEDDSDAADFDPEYDDGDDGDDDNDEGSDDDDEDDDDSDEDGEDESDDDQGDDADDDESEAIQDDRRKLPHSTPTVMITATATATAPSSSSVDGQHIIDEFVIVLVPKQHKRMRKVFQRSFFVQPSASESATMNISASESTSSSPYAIDFDAAADTGDIVNPALLVSQLSQQLPEPIPSPEVTLSLPIPVSNPLPIASLVSVLSVPLPLPASASSPGPEPTGAAGLSIIPTSTATASSMSTSTDTDATSATPGLAAHPAKTQKPKPKPKSKPQPKPKSTSTSKPKPKGKGNGNGKPTQTQSSKCTPSPTKSLAPSATWTTCPYVVRDGKVNPDVRSLHGIGTTVSLTQSVISNALAYAFTRTRSYSSIATSYISAFFLSPQTGMNPEVNYGQVIRGPGKETGQYLGILDFRGMVKVVNAIQVMKLSKSPDWTATLEGEMKAWTGKYLSWLQTSNLGQGAAKAPNNHNTFYTNQLAALHLYLNDTTGAANALKTYFSHQFLDQIATSGEQPFEGVRTRPFHYRCFNLEGMITNAKLGDTLGLNFWSAKSHYGSTIQTALDFILTKDPGTEDVSEVFPHVAAVAAAYGDPDGKYQSYLQKMQPNHTTQMYWFYDQPGALGYSPAAAQGKAKGQSASGKKGQKEFVSMFVDDMATVTTTATANRSESAGPTSTSTPAASLPVAPTTMIPFVCPAVFANATSVQLDDGVFVTCEELRPFFVNATL